MSNQGLYLGFHVGPRAGRHHWASAVTKLKAKVDINQAMHEPAALTLRNYFSKALNMLSYIAQLDVPRHKCFAKLERPSLNRVLHLATSAASLGTLHNFPELIGIKLAPMALLLLACRVRAAHSTIHNDIVDIMHQQLVNMCFISSNLGAIALRDFSPPGWHHPALVTNLHRALTAAAVPCEARNGVVSAVSSWLKSSAKVLQSLVCKALCAALPTDWPALFARRSPILCPSFTATQSSLGSASRLG